MFHKRIDTGLLTGPALLLSLMLTGCPEDPLGPDNRMALLALGQCNDGRALQLAERAIAQGSEQNVLQGLMLKAAILRDRGDNAAAEALYPQIQVAWDKAKRRALRPDRRERDIQMFIDITRDERRAHGLDPDCASGGAKARGQ
jgi:hypothetical protein